MAEKPSFSTLWTIPYYYANLVITVGGVVNHWFSSYLSDRVIGGGSGIIGSQLFIIPSTFFPIYSLLITKTLVDFIFQYSLILTETVKFFIPNVRTLNIPYPFSFLSRYSLFRFHPQECTQFKLVLSRLCLGTTTFLDLY